MLALTLSVFVCGETIEQKNEKIGNFTMILDDEGIAAHCSDSQFHGISFGELKKCAHAVHRLTGSILPLLIVLWLVSPKLANDARSV